jgi:hypothetical protein
MDLNRIAVKPCMLEEVKGMPRNGRQVLQTAFKELAIVSNHFKLRMPIVPTHQPCRLQNPTAGLNNESHPTRKDCRNEYRHPVVSSPTQSTLIPSLLNTSTFKNAESLLYQEISCNG